MEKAKKAIAINVKIDFHHKPYNRTHFIVWEERSIMEVKEGGDWFNRKISYVHFVIMGH